jgi:hypothetical protein
MITGPPGAGKTSVLERLSTLLEIEGVEFGALEAEQFGWGSPWLYGEPVWRQLGAVLGLQRDAGRRLFLIALTAETSGDLRAAAYATGAETIVTVLLSASPEVVAARIEEREPDDWPGKPALVAHARELAGSMPALDGIDLRLDTDHRRPDAVARELFDALRSSRVLG